MSELSNHYQQIMKQLQENIKDENEKAFVMLKFQELSMMFMDIIDRLTFLTDMKIKEITEEQQEIQNRIEKVQKKVEGIESDIYEDDDTYEFEIACPYCNHEFVTDINSEASTEVECPECHNVIELDWNGDEEECGHECSHCASACGVAEEELVYQANEEDKSAKKKQKEQEKKNKKSKQNEEDDFEDEEEDEDM